MKGNLLIQRYKSQIRIFRHSNGKISVGPEMEAIHQFRIAIKRIRVLLNLMEKVSRSEFRQEEHLILFGSLYREAGKLREAQINDSLLRSSGVDFPAAYMDYLHNIRTTAGQRLQEQILKFDFQKLSDLEAELENKIDPIPEKDIIEDAETEVLYQLRVIRKLRKKPSKRKNLHPIRIRLKGVIELLNLIMDSSGRADLTPLEEGCTRLSKELGKWHDLEMLLRSLREFGLQKHDDKPIREKVRKTIKLIHRDSVKQRKRIGKSLVKELP